MLGSRGLASLGPFLGAHTGPRGRLKYWGLGDRGLASPVPSWVPPSTSLELWTVYEMAVVVCQRHRSLMADVAVADVSVNMQCKFQQFRFSFFQFINRVVVLPVATQRQVRTALSVQRTVVTPRAQFLDLGVVPVLCNDKFWTVQKTVEMPQVQLLWGCRRLCDHAETSSWASRQVVDVPVVQVVVWGISCH